MAVRHLQAYHVLRANALILKGSVRNLKFTLPEDFVPATGYQRPVLTFMVRPLKDDTVLAAWVNRTSTGFVQDDELARWVWKKRGVDQAQAFVVDGKTHTLHAGQENVISFNVWKGEARLYSTVLYYHRRIVVPKQS